MDSSLLSRLPPEIRDQIYLGVFTSKYAVTLQSGLVQHPLTKTCRQVRRETLAMYYASTRFNAHLDDGPATPLAKWLTILGPDLTLAIKEINIWDMHMLNGTLHGEHSTNSLLGSKSASSESYALRPMGSWIFNRGWYLKDIILTLHTMGLGLSRLCVVSKVATEPVKLTSEFAIVRLDHLPKGEVLKDQYSEVNTLAEQFGLSEKARENLILQLAAGQRSVTLQERHRELILDFNESAGTRLKSIRQISASET